MKRNWLRIIGTAARALALLALPLVLVACSVVSLGYNRLPDLALLWLDRQMPLSDAQSAQARQDLTELLAWHRRTQLPLTIDLLRRWQVLAASDISAEQVCREWGEVQGLLDNVLRQATPALARLAVGTTADQQAELQRTQDKSNNEFRDAYLATPRKGWFTPAHAGTPSHAETGVERRLDNLRERYAQLYGTLTEAQVALLRERLLASGFQPEKSLAERVRRQSALHELLRQLQQPLDPIRTQTLVQAWLNSWTASPTPGYSSYARQLTLAGCEQLAAVHRITSADQRAHAVRTLRGYERDLRALAQQ